MICVRSWGRVWIRSEFDLRFGSGHELGLRYGLGHGIGLEFVLGHGVEFMSYNFLRHLKYFQNFRLFKPM